MKKVRLPKSPDDSVTLAPLVDFREGKIIDPDGPRWNVIEPSDPRIMWGKGLDQRLTDEKP